MNNPSQPRFLKLSYDLSAQGPLPYTIPPVKIEPFYTIEKGDGANVFVISFANHSGTHVDAPRHVAADGLRITAFSFEELRFRKPVCIDVALCDDEMVFPDHLKRVEDQVMWSDALLVRTGYGKYRSTDPERYRFHGPGFSVAAARFVQECFPTVRCIGMDTISFACIAHLEEGMEAHRVLLSPQGSRFLLIEDMNLSFDFSHLGELWVMPWLVEGIDSAPCTVVGLLESGS
jgi:kynurenine formamidase